MVNVKILRCLGVMTNARLGFHSFQNEETATKLEDEVFILTAVEFKQG
jgi:hypothetical protein